MRAIDKGPGLCDFINMVLLLNHAALTNNDTLQEACLLFTSLQLGFHNESGLLAQDPYEEETRQLCPSAALVFVRYSISLGLPAPTSSRSGSIITRSLPSRYRPKLHESTCIVSYDYTRALAKLARCSGADGLHDSGG
jgi:hypothetical protein